MARLLFSLFTLFGTAIVLLDLSDWDTPTPTLAAGEAVPTTENIDTEYYLLSSTTVTSDHPLVVGGKYLIGAFDSATLGYLFMQNTKSLSSYMNAATGTVNGNLMTVPTTSTLKITLGGSAGAYTWYADNPATAGQNYFQVSTSTIGLATVLTNVYDPIAITMSAATADIRFASTPNKMVGYLKAGTYKLFVNAPPAQIGLVTPTMFEKYGYPMYLSVVGSANAIYGSTGFTLAGAGISVRAYYRDGRYRDVTSTCTYTAPNTGILGAKSYPISYTYRGVTASSSYSIDVTNVGSSALTTFTAANQAAATRDYTQQYKTCPGGTTDPVVLRLAKEYNAMSVNAGGSNAKTLFKSLVETVNDYDFGQSSQYSNKSYPGGAPSVANVNIYVKLLVMVQWYNANHTAKIYLYDTVSYGGTDSGGSEATFLYSSIKPAGSCGLMKRGLQLRRPYSWSRFPEV